MTIASEQGFAPLSASYDQSLLLIYLLPIQLKNDMSRVCSFLSQGSRTKPLVCKTATTFRSTIYMVAT